jgi:hypothetical protein
LDEYRRYAFTSGAPFQCEAQFIELFDVDIVTLPKSSADWGLVGPHLFSQQQPQQQQQQPQQPQQQQQSNQASGKEG